MVMNTTFFAFGLGGWEIVGILGIALLMFGAKKLPELARGLGQGIKEFKKASRDVQNDLQRAIDNIEEDSSLPKSSSDSSPVEPPSSSKPEPTAADPSETPKT